MNFDIPAIEPSELESLPSPQLVIFRDRLIANLDGMIRMAGSPERLRPHCKTHKMAAIIRLWIERGVTKHKAATIAECEMLAMAGATDVLFAYNPVGPNLDRVVRLAQMYPTCRFTVTADAQQPIEALSASAARSGVEIGVMLDVNVGMNRTGTTPETDGVVELYKLTNTLPGLRSAGFHVYDGQQRQVDLESRKAAVAAEWPRVLGLKQRCEAAGVPVPKLACGGTPTFPCYAAMSDPTIELCPGTCVLHDSGYGMTFPDLPFVPAAWIVTRVVSRPGADRITLDVGNKAVAADPPKGARVYFPNLPSAVQDAHNEEHMVLVTDQASQYKHGDVLLAIPVHICPTSALYDRVPVIANGKIVESWEVTSRNRRITV